jgi:hypothetical protein
VDRKLRSAWRSYLFQSLCTVLVMLVVLLAFDLRQAIVITSLGATVFVVFLMTSSIPAHRAGSSGDTWWVSFPGGCWP